MASSKVINPSVFNTHMLVCESKSSERSRGERQFERETRVRNGGLTLGVGLTGGAPLRWVGLWACNCVQLSRPRQARAHGEREVFSRGSSGGGSSSRGCCGGIGHTRSLG